MAARDVEASKDGAADFVVRRRTIAYGDEPVADRRNRAVVLVKPEG